MQGNGSQPANDLALLQDVIAFVVANPHSATMPQHLGYGEDPFFILTTSEVIHFI